MVCNKCQKKLGKIITPDVWKSGARNTTGMLFICIIEKFHFNQNFFYILKESGGRSINENKALTSRKNRFQPYQKFETCKICKQKVHQAGSHYCQCKFCFVIFSKIQQKISIISIFQFRYLKQKALFDNLLPFLFPFFFNK